MRYPAAILFLAGGIVALGAWLGFERIMDRTSTMEFCISCHEMETTVYREYQDSAHAHNPSGVRATCPDCHVPREFGPKVLRKVLAVADLYHTAIGTVDTREKFEAKREELAERVWAYMRSNDSRECRTCHAFATMKVADQRPRAQEEHAEGVRSGKTCIDCHRGVTHRLPPRDD